MDKCKYWTAILYPESLPSNWEDIIEHTLQIPFAYCVHDRDLDKDGDSRKIHVHIVLAFNNTTTYKHALDVIKQISPTTATIKPVINIRYIYNYLIHDTDDSRKKGKFLYCENCRKLCNNFDIGNYEQISIADKHKLVKNVCDFIVNKDICNFTDFYVELCKNYDTQYLDVLYGYSGLFERLTRGNYLRHEGKKQKGGQR